MVLLRRFIGALLVASVAVPLYRLLPAGNQPAEHARRLTEAYAGFVWSGAAMLLLVAALSGSWIKPKSLEPALHRLGAWLARASPPAFATGLAILSGGLTLLFTVIALDAKAPFIDAMAQLVHARYWAEGSLAGPPLDRPEFWMFQNLVMTPDGWLSQYPPGHVALLGLGYRVGAVEAVGAGMAALAAFFTALAADRLLPGDRVIARVGALLAALSPFTIFLAGTFMNHVSAAALAAAAVYCMTRAWDDRLVWAAAAGAAIGGVFAIRPLTGIVVGAVLALGLAWRGPEGGAVRLAAYVRRVSAVLVGALPFGAAVALYNAHFFGSPTRFGYIVAQGPLHGLGFHRDPWGNMYGLAEAVGYTSSDLVALSRFLLQTPLPIVALIGAYLIVARELAVGTRMIVAWALLPVLANLFYWHHDLLMGPRMLAEVAPAWALLTAVAGAGLVRRVPAETRLGRAVVHPRSVVTVALLLGLVAGLGYFAPRQAARYGGDWLASTRVEPPAPPGPSLVFVHETWSNRLGARMAGRGLRQDSIVRLLASVPPCVLEAHLSGWIEPGASRLSDAQQRRIAAGCQREAASDRLGTTDLAVFLWQGDLPGLPARGAMFVRDLGPERNRWVLERFPERRPLVLAPAASSAAPELLPYDQTMEVLWPEITIGGTGAGGTAGGEAPGSSR